MAERLAGPLGCDYGCALADGDRRPAEEIIREARGGVSRERLIDAIEAEWLRRAEAKTVASPRQHSEAMADAILSALDGDGVEPPSDPSDYRRGFADGYSIGHAEASGLDTTELRAEIQAARRPPTEDPLTKLVVDTARKFELIAGSHVAHPHTKIQVRMWLIDLANFAEKHGIEHGIYEPLHTPRNERRAKLEAELATTEGSYDWSHLEDV